MGGFYSNLSLLQPFHKPIMDDKKVKDTAKTIYHEIPRGQPKSGRKWKTVQLKRHSQIKNVKRFKTSWNEKMAKKEEKKRIKELEESLKSEKDKAKEYHRMRTMENRKRKLENQRKSEIVVPIKDTRKIKRMKKKQLRQIETR